MGNYNLMTEIKNNGQKIDMFKLLCLIFLSIIIDYSENDYIFLRSIIKKVILGMKKI